MLTRAYYKSSKNHSVLKGLPMSYTYDNETISDLHKEVYGFRPTRPFFYEWDNSTPQVKQKIWDEYCRIVEINIKEMAVKCEYKLDEFESRIDDVYKYMSTDRRCSTDDDAIRIILQAEDFDENDYRYGASHCAYHFGLEFNNIYSGHFARVCQGVLETSYAHSA